MEINHPVSIEEALVSSEINTVNIKEDHISVEEGPVISAEGPFNEEKCPVNAAEGLVSLEVDIEMNKVRSK